MDPRITKEETALLLNLTPSRRAQEIEAIRLAAIRARDEAIGRAIRRAVLGVVRFLKAVGQFLVTYPERRALLEQLRAMSDRELADIGLTRADLARVFDPDFALLREPGRPQSAAAAPAATMPATTMPTAPAGAAAPEPANTNLPPARAA